MTLEQAQALDAVPECYDKGAPEVRTLVLALRDPGTPQERRKPAKDRNLVSQIAIGDTGSFLRRR